MDLVGKVMSLLFNMLSRLVITFPPRGKHLLISWLLDLHTNFLRGSSSGLVFPSLKEFSTVYCDSHSQRFGIVSRAEVDVFLELSCFFYDSVDAGNFISDFSAFSKTSLNIWKFMVHVLVKHSLENFEHYFTSMRWVQLCSSLSILWHCLSLGLE